MLYLIEGIPLFVFDPLEMGGCQTCGLFELARKMLNATISKLIGDFIQRKLIKDEQFLGDQVFFNSDSFNR